MRVIALVKYVPDTEGQRRLEPTTLRVDRDGAAGLLSELDEYAVEAALKVVEEAGGEVVAVTMGPADAVTALRGAMQLGADSGVHLMDDALVGSDTVATSAALAAAVLRLEADLVVTGMSSTDAGTGMVPAMVAERLGWPQATYADQLTLDGATVRVERDGDGYTEMIEAELPAVVGVTDRCNEPRYPSFRSIMAAKKKPVLTWSIEDLGLDPAQVGQAAAGTRVLGVRPMPERAPGRVITDAGDAGTRLAAYLAEIGLV